jgi:DNA-binding MarR family transcriptional regulator
MRLSDSAHRISAAFAKSLAVASVCPDRCRKQPTSGFYPAHPKCDMLTNLQALQSFLAVVREGGVGAAADRLHYSPSTVRTHVRLLEQQLHVQLLDRESRNSLLTAAGDALVPAVLKVDEAVAELERQAALIAQGTPPRKSASDIRALRAH